MKKRFIEAHMAAALQYSQLSYCNRRKVGCVIVKGDRIISIGYNGTPAGWDNRCEDADNITYPEVIHAEANAIAKLAKTEGGGQGASVLITHAPCLDCAKQLATMEVKEVYYANDYKNTAGVEHLLKCGIPAHQVEISETEIKTIKESNSCRLCQKVSQVIKNKVIRFLTWIIRWLIKK